MSRPSPIALEIARQLRASRGDAVPQRVPDEARALRWARRALADAAKAVDDLEAALRVARLAR